MLDTSGYSEFMGSVKDEGVVFDFHMRDGVFYYTLGILGLGTVAGVCIMGIVWYRTEKKRTDKEIK